MDGPGEGDGGGLWVLSGRQYETYFPLFNIYTVISIKNVTSLKLLKKSQFWQQKFIVGINDTMRFIFFSTYITESCYHELCFTAQCDTKMLWSRAIELLWELSHKAPQLSTLSHHYLRLLVSKLLIEVWSVPRPNKK